MDGGEGLISLELSLRTPSLPRLAVDVDHRIEQEASFPCMYCNHKFFCLQALAGHQNAHRVERAYAMTNVAASSSPLVPWINVGGDLRGAYPASRAPAPMFDQTGDRGKGRSLIASSLPPVAVAQVTYACNYCDRKFFLPQALGGHQKSHRLQRTYVMPQVAATSSSLVHSLNAGGELRGVYPASASVPVVDLTSDDDKGPGLDLSLKLWRS